MPSMDYYYWTLSNHGSNFSTCSSGTTNSPAVTTTTLNGNFSGGGIHHPWQHHPTSDFAAPATSTHTHTYNPQSSSSSSHADPLTSSCLKLGKRHYFQNDDQPLAAANKKNNSYYCSPHGAPRCQVEGCGATLVNAKEYHRRHKVCAPHAKSPTVIVRGIRQRFCQQCSRFHSVAEFDDTKRSCRRRLAGHNHRRRKTSQNHINSRPDSGNKLRHTNLLDTTRDCALSLLSPYNNDNNNLHQSSDLPARCSAALRELIAENRACRQLTQLCCRNKKHDRDLYTTNKDYKLGSTIRAAGWNSGHHAPTTSLAQNTGFGLNDPDKNAFRDGEAGGSGCSGFWKPID